MNTISKHLINSKDCIKLALEKLNNVPENLTLFVTDDSNKLVGTITDGDIRRGLLAGKSITDPVEQIVFRNFTYIKKNSYSIEVVKIIREKRIKLVPLVDDDFNILKLIDFSKIKTILPVDAVIMAGGRGERLKPFTDTIPKSLLKVGDKPILEHNIDRLIEYGVDEFSLTLRYLGDKISEYFGDGSEKGVKINYITENIPLGTIGSVSLIKEFSHDTVLIMNSDLLTNIDFEDIYLRFINDEADMTVASIPYNVDLPYAVLETKDGEIRSFKEKPTYTYYSNAGIYFIKAALLKNIPIEKHFNATDFMQLLLDNGHKVTFYPIIGYWLDIGRHEDYAKANEDIKHIKF
jgi:dTDP-glucose pyrophosphorylase